MIAEGTRRAMADLLGPEPAAYQHGPAIYQPDPDMTWGGDNHQPEPAAYQPEPAIYQPDPDMRCTTWDDDDLLVSSEGESPVAPLGLWRSGALELECLLPAPSPPNLRGE
jgi:hypothetical protein